MIALLVGLCIGVGGCAARGQLRPSGGFQAPLGRTHPLVGKVWSRAEHAFIGKRAVIALLADARALSIGESHDNVDHHQLQAFLLTHWLRVQASPAVAFEMLDEEQAVHLTPTPGSPDELARRVQWDRSGWPEFAIYRPVFEAVLEAGAPIIAAHPSKARVRASMHGVPPEEAQALALDEPLPTRERDALVREIEASHCGHASPAMVEGMLRAQSYKDAYMAGAMRDAERPVALIAGRGHVMRERGVPLFLQRRVGAPGLVIGLLEVEDSKTRIEDYPLDAFDLTVFTPRMSDEDPCAVFREQLERMKKAHGAAPSGQ